jgi:hypothetical protein
MQHFEEVDGPLVPAGKGLPQFVNFKEDKVHWQ